MEQKNWTAVRQLVGYLRYDAEAELLLLNKIWALQGLIGNHFYPQQKLTSKVRDGARITKKYDTATTPYGRTIAHTRQGTAETTTARTARLVQPCRRPTADPGTGR